MLKISKMALAALCLTGGVMTATLAVPTAVAAEPAFQVAQGGWKAWNWSQYNVKFQLPADMRVLKSNANEFSLTSPNFSLYIVPWQDSSLTAKDVAYLSYKNYTVVSNKTVQGEGDISSDIGETGFEGYALFGRGWDTKAGRWLHYGIIGMVNPNSPVNFYVRFAWWDNPQTNAYYEQLSENIAKTFSTME